MVIFGATARRVALVVALSVGILAGIGLAMLAIVPAIIPSSEIRRAATEALTASSGREVRLLGDASFSLLPSPRVTLGKLEFAMPGGAALDSDNAVAKLRLMPLLVGRVEVASVTLARPTLTMTGPVAVPHLSLASFVTGPGAPALRVVDGTIAWRDKSGLTQELVSGINAQLDHSSGGKGISASADFMWRDAPASGRVAVTDAAAFIDGIASETRLDLTSGSAWARFRGEAAAGEHPTAEGEVSGDAQDLRTILAWVGTPAPTSGGFGRFSFGAHLSAFAGQVSLTPAYVELDGNRSEGGVTVKLDGKHPLVEGTFAADTLNLTPYGRVALTGNGGQDWDHDRLDVSGLRAADLDLRLSAAKVRADETQFERVATTAVLRGGRLVLSLGEAQGWGGMLRASLTLAPAPSAADGVAVRVEAEGTDVLLERALGDTIDVRRIDGTGNIQAHLEGTGTSIYGIAQSLAGDVSISGASGAIVGLDVAQALRRIEQRPLSGGGDLRGGRTAYDTLKAKARVERGVATLQDVQVEGKQVHLTLDGAVSVVQRDLDLKGVASLVSSAGAIAQGSLAQGSFQLPFIVQGPWDSPYVMPDAQSLIQRSGAAQPLLDAVRSHGGDAAVRSVIEQLAKPSALLPTALPKQAN